MDKSEKPEVELVNSEDWHQDASTGSAPSDVLLRKEFVSEIEAGEDRTIKFVISTGDPDREKDIISADGWNTSNYLKNPVVLFAHDYASLPVARASNVKLENGNLVAEAEFADEKLNPMAEQVYQMLKQGFLRGASVGFRPLEFQFNEQRGGVDFAKQELLEFSVVPVPANPGALMSAGLSADSAATLKEWAIKTLNALEPKAEAADNVNTEWREVVLEVARLDEKDLPNGDIAEVKSRLAKHYEQVQRVAPWERDGAAWSAYIKARTKLKAKLGFTPTEDHLAYLLDDHGFEDEAIILVSSSKQVDSNGAVAAPSPLKNDLQEASDDPVMEAVNRLTEQVLALEQSISAAPSLNSQDEEAEPFLEIEDGDCEPCNEVEIDTEELKRAVRSALRDSVGDVVGKQMHTALNLMRGRID